MIYRQWLSRAVLLLAVGLAFSAFAANSSRDKMATQPSDQTGHIKVSEHILIDAQPQAIWNTVGDFNAISSWHPAIESSNIVSGKNNQPGAKRHLKIKGGGTVTEQLVARNNQKMRYTYRILKSSLPVTHYRSVIAVIPKGKNQSVLVWEGRFDSDKQHSDAQARQVIRKVYRAGLTYAKTMLGKKHS